ncbi:MAG: alpha/beta fold hydrolase [Chloroflexi bacterium AL-W]|nr:alpha/beta fold hydrolase [Chloroflexi bacterium AL-N1]NOK69543.1 alpha/beta fold hydrolase [Chloroflexi bacterium AL-N10]NOK77508.1 alpha/beta fold hydrolase [Chloroflexi bacterium AL-N5]NOK84359.1 alpha/beta fold hydrolase [Chloroflexi bacterium AL-W]NOK91475.1 alpha/beta fold hydrolase [Chloroflexi bacterium AL-N15]
MQQLHWLNQTMYPFRSHFLKLDAGRMHYIDEGQGPPLVFVHGTPVWSFLYRDMIKELSKEYRCIAMDHLGFGLSDKPANWGYRPADHAHNVRALIEHLGLEQLALVVHDFGGPIGLSYAIEQPENVTQLVVFNTWMWSLKGNAEAERVSNTMGGQLGRILYQRFNFSARVLVKMVMADQRKLTKEVHQHYIKATTKPQDRQGMWRLACELTGSSEWYDGLWQQRERIRDIPVLLLWGMQDLGVKGEIFDVKRWQNLFTNQKTVLFPDAGHFVQEEEPQRSTQEIAAFLSSAKPVPV